MTKIIGYAFLLLGLALLVMGVQRVGLYLKQPETFTVYRMLTELPPQDRTIQLQQGSMELPSGFFKATGMLSIFLAGFLMLGVVKLVVGIGLKMLAANTRDLAKDLIAEMRRLEHKDIVG